MAILKGWEMRNLFKKVCLSSAEGTNRRGRLLGRWKDKVREYVSERKWVGVGKEGVHR